MKLLTRSLREKKFEVRASEPRNDKRFKDSPPFDNAISRQSISTVAAKVRQKSGAQKNF